MVMTHAGSMPRVCLSLRSGTAPTRHSRALVGVMTQWQCMRAPQIAHWVLNGSCIDGAGRRRLVLDVGAAMGYYTIMAAMYGCQ